MGTSSPRTRPGGRGPFWQGEADQKRGVMMNVVGALSTQECLALLGKAGLGRLAFTERALPAVRPVAFAVDDGVLVLRGSPPEAFRFLDRQIVALEIDDIDPVTGCG